MALLVILALVAGVLFGGKCRSGRKVTRHWLADYAHAAVTGHALDIRHGLHGSYSSRRVTRAASRRVGA